MDYYINRSIEKEIDKLSKEFPVVMISGPRQVGKTTLLKHLQENKKINYITLDDMKIRKMAVEEPELLLKTYPTPLIIDEFQYAPNLLSYIKIEIDNIRYKSLKNSKENPNGKYYLTGSQVFKTTSYPAESLAGRVGIIDLYGLSMHEINHQATSSEIFIPDLELIKKRQKQSNKSVNELYEIILKGSFPQLWNKDSPTLETFYETYIRTYIERDIRDLSNIKDELKFYSFIVAIAARTGCELNYSSLSEELGITIPTAKDWLSILVNSGLVYLLQPFSTNLSNRLIKSPKIYFMDTGLACYLVGYKDAITLEKSAYNGAIFETFVVTEIIKSFTNNGYNPKRYLSFYRDKAQKEIDLIIEFNKKIYPIEIKKSKNPNQSAVKNFSVLNKLNNVEKGIVLCLIDDIFPIDKYNYSIPIEYI